jgi:hypothetical protein
MEFLKEFEGVGTLRKGDEPGLTVTYKIEVYQEELAYKPGTYGRLLVFGKFAGDFDRLIPYADSEAVIDKGNGVVAEILVHGEPGRFIVNKLPPEFLP